MAPTPAEVIAQQHEDARQLILLSAMPYAAPPSHDEISLGMKTCPTMELFGPRDKEEEEEEEKKSCGDSSPVNHTGRQQNEDCSITTWSSRGYVDVSQLQKLVTEGYRIAEHTQKKVDDNNNSNNKNSSNKKKKTTNGTTTNNNQKKTNGTATNKSTTTNNTNNNTTTTTKQKLLQSGGPRYTTSDIKSQTNLWDPVNAAVTNVHIVRPSHDAWGIGKIVLIFADDFLKDTYELPWWHLRPDFQQAVAPILTCLGIQSTQIVRLLLASLPPGTTIPLHQDSGAWVAQTHRVHVPIIVTKPDEIMFRVGLTDDCLERIDCTPGHVFEMNNQCRHAVSNCSDDYRVHLILDYCDAPLAVERIQLEAGEKLLQTRRSVDRLKNQGSRPTPSFMILGAQKAGTTSLYEYMMQHPLIVRPKRRETHCLDWRWKEEIEKKTNNNGNSNTNSTKTTITMFTDEELRAHCHLFYETEALKLHPSCCTGDSTPSYLLDSRRVIPRLKQVFPWRISFLILTRDPIERAESHYAMVTSPEGTPAQLKTRGAEWRNKSFGQVVQDEFQNMQACGLIPYWDMDRGVCDGAIFDAFTNTTQEDQAWQRYVERHVPLHTGSYGLLARGLYALQLRPWLAPDVGFDPRDFLCLSLQRDLSSANVQATMERVFDHVGVPSSYTLNDVSPQNTRQYEPKMDQELYQVLQRFFEPHNQRWDALVASLPNQI